ncbi:MAG: helix-turn-helix domain-containing protein [Burkholderia contaminans]|uniref:Helix-turn-helix domain-containing protein n=2 Tax=Burkholderia cepacia complex TaxID=87882 RepID=A0AAP4VG48_9BURK|nr:MULTISPECIES: helix-turn-helix transcriptional regulator [Burkholderia]MBD1410207.1 helix-turn-helix domain-containing protein [Burkholderia contaminans]MBH9666303.1 helix-turn-helix domain-containing protein [Burkholderia contaminans]MBH9674147.1 helix-turn-helix domain-containing protein [Burkholderia contaminans]MBH9704193.1 helix-turn-helix domain-containing protein [Burkholderia contaminans]MBH9719348.1 helix-turn-helix domain-containing protein [Burkholderia contaminans]
MAFPVQTLTQLRPILVGFRKAAGLTQAQLAARLGVTQQSYAQLEANPSAVSIERLFKVLNALGVHMTLAPGKQDVSAASADPVPVPDATPAVRKPASSKRKPETARGAPPARNPAKPATGAKRKRPADAAPGKPRVSKREDW